MRIFIITMDDPIHTNDFIKSIIDHKRDNIIGLAVSKGNRLTLGKKKSKFKYLVSLLLIMGLPAFIKNSWISLFFKLRKIFSAYSIGKSPSILSYAKSKEILTFQVKTPNSKRFLEELRAMKPDVIINQSQNILKNELLSIPTIGTINRHNALLPKNRGRLTPFWVLYKDDKETGVSIHFVNEKIDAGNIIVQEKYEVEKNDNFNSIVKKNYEIAPKAILSALKLLEEGYTDFIQNDDNCATYNSVPTLREAIYFRIKRIKRIFWTSL